MRQRDLVRRLIDDLSAGIRVLRDRDGLDLSEDLIRERASNLAAAVLGNYDVRCLDDEWSVVATYA
jgi:hypothetical protein